jgi:arylsulfatase A-like enzyme
MKLPGWFQRLAKTLPLRVGTPATFCVAVQIAALIASWSISDATGQWELVAGALWSAVATILLFRAVNLSLLHAPKTRAGVNLAILVLIASLALYRFTTGHAFDYFLLADNVALLTFGESWRVLLARVSAQHWIALVGVLAIGTAIGLRREESSRPRYFAARVVGAAALLLVFVLTPLSRHHDLLYVARSAYDYHFASAITDVDADEEYPYVKRATGESRKDGPRPHIFIVMMESLNANFVEAKTPDGREYTPVFNSLIPKGVFVERHYANGVQTPHGQLGILCSILPSLRGKVFTDRPNLSLRSLPTILKEHGYNTLFFKGYKSLRFDNTGEFMAHIGFEEIHAMDADFVTDEDKQYIWGWGLQDDRTYQKVFSFMDQRADDELKRPDFVVIHTVSHHYPFDHLPREKWLLFPDAADPKEHIANSTFLADQFLGEFFRQLELQPQYADSLVIVTGDHSFPAGEHDGYHNEHGFYDEHFRTPFLLLWPGKVEPRRIDVCCSHLDIAPTLLDLLQIETDNHFMGQSVLTPLEAARSIYVVQPYNGPYLAVIQYPFKYVRGLRTPGELLFNLADDPKECENIIEGYRDTELHRRLKAEIAKIRLNQRLIDEDRIWPKQVAKQ